MRGNIAQFSFAWMTICIATSACSKKSSGGGDEPASTGTVVSTGTVATNDNSGGTTSGGTAVTGNKNDGPDTVAVTGTVTIAGKSNSSSGMSLTTTSEFDGYYVKAMTADLNPATCIDDVDSFGDFGMGCDGFRGKQLIAAILKDKGDGTFDIAAVATDLGGINPTATAAEVNLMFDPDTGSVVGQVQQFSDSSGVKTAVDGVSALPASLANLSVNSGMYNFRKYFGPDLETEIAWRNGDFSTLPDRETRDQSTWAEPYYVRFTAATSSASPRLSVWTSEAAADACSAGYALKDGTHTLSSFTYADILTAIQANGWAPQAAIDRYIVAKGNIGEDLNEVGYRQADQAGRQLVEELFFQLAEEKYRHDPNDRYEAVKSAYSTLSQEARNSSITDATRLAIARSWARMTTDDDLRQRLELAITKFTTTDFFNLGGTGKVYIDTKIDDLLTYDAIGALVSTVYNWDYVSASLEQHIDFMTQWKDVNPDSNTTRESEIDAVLAKLNDVSMMIQASGIQDVQNILDGISAAQSLVQEACSTEYGIDFSPIFAETDGKTAFNDLLAKVDLAGPDNGNSTTIKGGVVDPARTIFQDFASVVGPIIGGCGKLYLDQQLAGVTQNYYWSGSSQIPINDSDKDANAIAALNNLSDALTTAKRGLALYTISIRDPNLDGVALFNTDSTQNNAYNTTEANQDFTALVDKINDLITSNSEFVDLCTQVLFLGGTPSACSDYTGAGTSSDNIFRRLFDLQNLIAEVVTREAYQADPTFQATIRQIGAKSTCMPDAWVAWDPTVAGSSVSFAVSLNAPVSMLMDAPISVVPTEGGDLAFFADGSRLESATFWDYETSTEKPCTRGEVRILSHITFDSSKNLSSAVFRDGWKDTCYSGGDSPDADYTSTFFTDFELLTNLLN